jgi:hypothetical protein
LPEWDRTRFAQVWAAYPKHKHQGAAERAWDTLRPEPALVDQMLATIAKSKTTMAWRRDRGKYVPYLAKWLEDKCWTDQAHVDVPPIPAY